MLEKQRKFIAKGNNRSKLMNRKWQWVGDYQYAEQ
jgi:hypothetical protein